MVETIEKAILRNYVSSFAGLTEVTIQLLDKQVIFVRQIARWAPKFQEASSRIDFWKVAAEGLSGSEVASLFVSLGKMQELSNSLPKFGTLKEAEQEKLVKEYKGVGKALSELSQKLNRRK